PSLVPDGPTIRNMGPAPNFGQAKYMLSRYLKERGDSNIKTIRDLIDKSNFYRDIRPDAGFIDRRAALEEINSALTLDLPNLFLARFDHHRRGFESQCHNKPLRRGSPGRKTPPPIS